MLKTTISGKPKLSLLLCLIGLLCFSAPRVRAQQPDQAPPSDQVNQLNQAEPTDPSAQSEANDPPTRVARISYVDGSVSLQARRSGRLGQCCAQSPDDHWRQNLDRQRFTRRITDGRRFDPSWQHDGTFFPESRSEHYADATRGGLHQFPRERNSRRRHL